MSGCILRNILCKGIRLKAIDRTYRLTSWRHMSLLSSTYLCTEPWKDRLKCPILSKADANDFIIKVQDKIERQQPMSPLDIDIIANRLTELSLDQMNFVQSLFQQFRKTQPSLPTFPSTPYAIIRSLLENGDTPRLIEMLKDKLGYGIFLEPYTANLLLDYCIENQEYQFAADVAFEQMLQEDFSHPITKALSWYACHLYWKNPPVVEAVEEVEDGEGAEEEGEEEDEMKYIPVKFIEKPFYDDHFDLPTDKLRLGKTLVMLTKGHNDLMANSYRLLGWAHYEKFDKGLAFLREIVDQDEKDSLAQEAYDDFKELLNSVETKETPEEKEAGLLTMEDLYPYITSEQKAAYKAEFEELEKTLSVRDILTSEPLEPLLKQYVTRAISEHQDQDIAENPKRYALWQEHRQKYLDNEIEDFRIEQKKQQMIEKIIELRAQDEKLRYFEQVDQIDLGIANKTTKDAPEKVDKEEVFVAAPGERGRGVS